ncbi:MAG TPA: STAS domain-containing protein [Anaerolineaceae bacterium]
MEITSTPYKRCDLVKPVGRIDSGTSPRLQDALNAITEAGRFKVVIDLSGVEFMSSAGLRVLVNSQKNCRRFNRGELVLASVPKNICASLDLAGFVPLFKIFDDVTAAVGYF